MSNTFIYEKDNIKTKLEQIDMLTSQIKVQYESMVKKHELKVSETIKKPKSWIKFPNKCNYTHGKWQIGGYPSDLFVSGYFNTEVSTMEALDAWKDGAIAAVNKYIEDCSKIVEQNKEVAEHNNEVRLQVRTFMEELGVPATFSHSYFKTSRSSRKTTETRRAGYLEDLDRLIGGPSTPSLNVDYYTQGLDKKYEELKQKILQKEREALKKKQQEEALHKISLVRAKYTPEDYSSTYEDILEVILNKNKYLKLAHYLLMNRNDWSDGCNYAELGINSFSVEDTIDQEIHDEISGLIDDWDSDGRAFRDCEYNYSVLFGMVDDAELMKDYDKIYELVWE